MAMVGQNTERQHYADANFSTDPFDQITETESETALTPSTGEPESGAGKVPLRMRRYFCYAVALFFASASIALYHAGWGTYSERMLFFVIAGISGVMGVSLGRLSINDASVLGHYFIVAFLGLQAYQFPGVGDKLMLVALAGVVAILGAGQSVKFDTKEGGVVIMALLFFWAAGWLIFFLNAPTSLHPLWFIKIAMMVRDGIVTVIATVVEMIIYAIMMLVGLVIMIGRFLGGITMPRWSSTPQNKPVAFSRWANDDNNHISRILED